MLKSLEQAVIKELEVLAGRKARIQSLEAAGGGCIHNGGRLKTSEGDFFLKYNSGEKGRMLLSEASGLKLLRDAKAIAVPEVYIAGEGGNDHYFLLMEYIERGTQTEYFWEKLGKGLAQLHRVSSSKGFGLEEDNFIGSLPQVNSRNTNWTEFFICTRLEPQLKLARDNGYADRTLVSRFGRLYDRLSDFFPVEPPALVHGDLWSGNMMAGPGNEAFVIDPAPYYGHREMDIAFSKMFGGFSPAFYQYYNEAYPQELDFDKRADLYNLYPLLVHVNLFGESYLHDVKRIVYRF